MTRTIGRLDDAPRECPIKIPDEAGKYRGGLPKLYVASTGVDASDETVVRNACEGAFPIMGGLNNFMAEPCKRCVLLCPIK